MEHTRAEALIKVIAYLKNNEIRELIEGKLEKEVEKEIKSRIPQPKKIKKTKKIGKVKFCGKLRIIESLTGIRKQYVRDLLRLRSFNEMRIISD